MKPSTASPEVVVVGAGPAGLAAAIEFQRRGLGPVVVLDRDDALGGLPRFCSHPGFGWEYSWRFEEGPAFVRRMLSLLDGTPVEFLTRTTALAIRPGPEVEIVGPETGHTVLKPRAVMVATGIREAGRGARLLPGCRPPNGIYTTGLLQQMIARGVPAGEGRCVIVGSEHVAFSAILTARKAGLQAVAMVEEAPRIQSFRVAGTLARQLVGIDILTSTKLVDIEASERPSAVVVETPSATRRISCESIVLTADWKPEVPLLRSSDIPLDRRSQGPIIDQFMRTGMPGVFAAGNVLRGVESSGMAALEGARAATCIAAYAAGRLTYPERTIAINVAEPLSYVCPQRWAVSGETNLRPQLKPSLRISKDVQRAKVAVEAANETLWESRERPLLSSRRLPLNLDVLDQVQADTVTVAVVD